MYNRHALCTCLTGTSAAAVHCLLLQCGQWWASQPSAQPSAPRCCCGAPPARCHRHPPPLTHLLLLFAAAAAVWAMVGLTAVGAAICTPLLLWCATGSVAATWVAPMLVCGLLCGSMGGLLTSIGPQVFPAGVRVSACGLCCWTVRKAWAWGFWYAPSGSRVKAGVYAAVRLHRGPDDQH